MTDIVMRTLMFIILVCSSIIMIIGCIIIIRLGILIAFDVDFVEVMKNRKGKERY